MHLLAYILHLKRAPEILIFMKDSSVSVYLALHAHMYTKVGLIISMRDENRNMTET